ncbi:putative alpha-L-Arabinofuranosidase B [Xylaria bambusicola]|uniref:putative alpha-L-Arabinofuranosidase B n=1 Tax=Xylaria bambusicola TaxID=326684 RepID=UPI002008AC49|nr:putative alpha-L-Arabinofuranosidase B [Xylaria bambusicola]KAI0515424.1 putative alpha-L-Arabinofuranosidase B [Xylaria bambusicola]
MPISRNLAPGIVAALLPLAAAGPCDIYGSNGTPCVAAHSTTRALFFNYNSPLYTVQRVDGTYKDILPVSAGGVADSAAQDEFCIDTGCWISAIYDQSGNGNDLTRAPPGGAAEGPEQDGYDALADATAAKVTLGGSTVYGVYVSPGIGYRNDETTNIPTGNAAQGIYAVLDGSRYNGECCFDYGNAETNDLDNGNGHMQALYFGLGTTGGHGSGDGPWVMADLENGVFAGADPGEVSSNPTANSRFVTGVVKGMPNYWEILVGDATSGDLSTGWAGVRPNGYEPLEQEGAIILGIGGDNSNWAEGTFYEGVITDGFPSDEVDQMVQADIVAAGYSV